MILLYKRGTLVLTKALRDELKRKKITPLAVTDMAYAKLLHPLLSIKSDVLGRAALKALESGLASSCQDFVAHLLKELPPTPGAGR